MIKNYKFRMEPVLKLRKLKEENCRTELGQLLNTLQRLDDQLAHDKAEIATYYKIQEGSLRNGMRGDQLQAFPMLVAAKERNVQLLQRDRQKGPSTIAPAPIPIYCSPFRIELVLLLSVTCLFFTKIFQESSIPTFSPTQAPKNPPI